MYRGTTPTYIFTFPQDVNLNIATSVYVTFAEIGGDVVLQKTGEDLTIAGNKVSVFLDQEESLSLPASVEAQINWLYDDNGTEKRACSETVAINTKRNLLERVMF